MKIYPDVSQTRVIFTSSAEEQMYELFKSQLSKDWRVYFSCNLSLIEGQTGMKDNETDFVLYHPKCGIIVLEVKGGRISYEAAIQQFYSINRHGEKYEIKDPFKQVLVWKSRFIRYLKKQQITAPVTHAVCFPSVEADLFPESSSFNKNLILGREHLASLEKFFKNLCQISHAGHFLKFENIDRDLDRILIGKTFTSRLYIRDYIDGHERRVRDVESLYDSLVTPITSRLRLGVEGEAGTGKTMIALLVAKYFRNLGQEVLFLSSNPILNLLMSQEAGESVAVNTYAGLAESFGVNLLTKPSQYSGSRSDWVQIDGPVLLKEAISKKELRYDVIICDEAQDVQPFWWDAFEELARNEESRVYLFFDRSQGIFGSGGLDKKFDPNDTLPIEPPFFPLVNNYRTTREIAGFARSFRTGGSVLQSHCGRLGYVPELVTYKDTEDCRRQLGRIFRNLVRTEKIRPEEMTILTARDPRSKESVLYKTEEIVKIPLHRLTYNKKKKWRETRSPNGHVTVATISAYKGLETKIGILLNISEYNLPLTNPIMSSLVYVACTRAKHMLYICVREDDKKRKIIEKALSEVKARGALVLGGSDKDFEFAGTVSHYNPERVGWMQVEDPAFQKSTIMFFPADVNKARIEKQIKVGVKLKFRPKLEANVTIASDLSLVSS